MLKSKLNWILWVGVSILVLVGVGVAIRRELYLTRIVEPLVNPKYGPFDAAINENSFLTWLHIVPGTIYLVLGVLQFVKRLRTGYPQLHRWFGRICVTAGLIIGSTALLMSFITPIGGLNETFATVTFASLFLFALLKGFVHILRREVKQHREWMIRAFAIALAIATVRPIVGMFFAFSGLTPREFFGTAFWLGFTIHLIAAEVWLNYTRPGVSSILAKS